MKLRTLPSREELVDAFPHIPTEELDRDMAELEELFMAAIDPDPSEPWEAINARNSRIDELCKKYGVK